MMHYSRDAILEGVKSLDLAQLQALADGRNDAASPEHIARLQAKGWVESHDGVHLITLTGRTLLDRPPFAAV